MINNHTVKPHNSFYKDSELATQIHHEMLSSEEAQEIIYGFLLRIVNQWHPEAVLQEFKNLFIQDTDSSSSEPIKAIYELVFADNQVEFNYTLKRSCYILVNNWIAKRQHKYVQDLIELFVDPTIRRRSLSPTINRLRTWIQIFVNSKDYQELELYIHSKSQEQSRKNKRYAPYLLAAQYGDVKNPIEQREAALNRAQQLRYRFKFDLVMYMARFESAHTNHQNNPTEISYEALRIIKAIATKRDPSTYAKIADAFIKQVKGQDYKHFKQNLPKYLFCFGESQVIENDLKLKFLRKLALLYEQHDTQALDSVMLQKTCHKVINYLTTEDSQQPSHMLVTLTSQVHHLTLVTILIKIILICQPARTHLESCIADLIRYHEKNPEKCSWMVNFVEIFNVMFAIYADNMPLQLK